MGRVPKTLPKGRKYKFPDCERLLSIYNHSPYCHIHRNQVSLKEASKAPYYHRA